MKRNLRSLLVLLLVSLPIVIVESAAAQNCTPTGTNDDCNSNSILDTCDVANGTSPDCNNDEIPDECQLGEPTLVIGGPDNFIKLVGANDCDGNLVPDDCQPDCDDDGKPDVCEADVDGDAVPDSCETAATCQGSCLAAFPNFDEDHDSSANCQEVQDATDPCDAGSFVQRLAPAACGSPNGFFNQINIATVLNLSSTEALQVRVGYRDQSGVVRGTVDFSLPPGLKQDVIVNDLGLQPDTVGTVCVVTNARTMGAWTGGLTIYKERTPGQPFNGATAFDYALYYPFVNPQVTAMAVPVNTNTIGTDGLGTVANWIRVLDAIPGDGRGVKGTLSYYRITGESAGLDNVDLPDGGRGDFAAHAALGSGQVGLALFTPTSISTEYYIEATRYFYEGAGATATTFYTAFPVPVQHLTAQAKSGQAKTNGSELAIVELVNGTTSPVNSSLALYDVTGNQVADEQVFLAPQGSVHRMVTNEVQTSAGLGSARASANSQALLATTLTYGFDAAGALLYGYAVPFADAAGAKQVTEFNSFINHQNSLEAINESADPLTVTGQVISYDQKVLQSFNLALPPHSTQTVDLQVPADTYGTVVAEASAPRGLVLRNNVLRNGQYVMSFLAKPGQ